MQYKILYFLFRSYARKGIHKREFFVHCVKGLKRSFGLYEKGLLDLERFLKTADENSLHVAQKCFEASIKMEKMERTKRERSDKKEVEC
jgi:hypothetical protein